MRPLHSHALPPPAAGRGAPAAAAVGVLRVGLLQMDGAGLGPAARAAKLRTFTQRAAASGAHLAVTPAAWLRGTTAGALHTLAGAARGAGIALAGAWIGADGLSRLALVDASGAALLNYSKAAEGPGSTPTRSTTAVPPTAVLSVPGASGAPLQVVVGGLLRSDVLLPEPARLLMLQGAQLIVVAAGKVAGPLRADALALTVANRARENAAAVVAATAADDKLASVVAGRSASPGVSVAAGAEGVALADVGIAQMLLDRQTTTEGDNYRRPYDYQPLCFEDTDAAGHAAAAAPPPPLPAAGLGLARGGAPSPRPPLELVVALLQMRPNTTFSPTNDTAAWLVAKAERFVRAAAEAGADVALMPELWSVGYEALFPCECVRICTAVHTRAPSAFRVTTGSCVCEFVRPRRAWHAPAPAPW